MHEVIDLIDEFRKKNLCITLNKGDLKEKLPK
jgi:hypothetical protein